MLSRENNERLTHVGAGTPMGNLLRRFWFPALLEEEIQEPDSPPIRIRLLGEDLVAFKDSDGRIGIVQEHCRHRRASLFFGRNEECGLRCVYHGWKFDVDGNCVDMPSEPNPSKSLIAKAKIAAYPATARGGVVWIYMGPAETQPARLPEFEFARLSKMNGVATKRKQFCNWAQAVEGGIDSAHISYLHSKLDFDHPLTRDIPGGGQGGDRHPHFDVRDTDYGLLIGARREDSDPRYYPDGARQDAMGDNHYWRVTQFLVPFYQMIPGPLRNDDDDDIYFGGHAWVPIDDENTWTWSFGTRPVVPFTEKERDHVGGKKGYWGPVDDDYVPLQNRENDYGLDRELQKNVIYPGIPGIPNQDAAVQESMGTIVDRGDELLGHSDTAIANYRKLLIEMSKDLEAGQEPAAARHGEWYNVRSASLLIPRDQDWVEGSAHRRAGLPLEQTKEAAE